ncbi:hypothetical protein [Streptomyces xanthophaeus]
MHHTRRRGRRAAPPRPREEPSAPLPVRPDVVLVGFFSAKQKDFAALMDAAAADLTAHGVRVVGRIVQRRGVSHGGAAKMSLPLSPQTLLGYGKAREAAAACERTGADAAVFLRPLTDRQRRTLTALLGCPALTLAEALTRDRSGSRSVRPRPATTTMSGCAGSSMSSGFASPGWQAPTSSTSGG